jgi:short subunit dehydrogenase-like uncharacterized protein
MVYGATGFTGRLVVQAALERGLRPLLAGRNAERLEHMASAFDLEYRVASLDDADVMSRLLADIKVMLLTAGPFSETATSVATACIRGGVHYLDLTGECAVFETLRRLDRAARIEGCTVMPGCGFDVVASDCLARHVSGRGGPATTLAIGVSGLEAVTRGSLRTLAQQAGQPIQTRRHGGLHAVPPGSLRRRFDYGRGDGWSTAVTWGDVITAYHSTGIPNIQVFFEETPALVQMLSAGATFGPLLQLPMMQAWLRAHAELLPEGPSPGQRARHSCVVVAQTETRDGRRAASRLRTPEAYTFSARAAAAIAERALDDDIEPGFQTPARVYGADFVLQFDGVTREDLEVAGSARRQVAS